MRFFRNIVTRWYREEQGMAAVEMAMIFPMMLVLFVGVIDLGNAILANQKTIRASQVVADLLARQNVVSDDDVAEAILAGQLALEPLDASSLGIDVISIRFDEDAASEIIWRETVNMTPVSDPLSDVAALQDSDEGVVMVAVRYDFEPMFSGFVIDTIEMSEVAFSRGRSSPVVVREQP